MLDHFIWGTVSRISPEAPVPVVRMSRETEMPGGAGNVAVNMAALGAEVHVIGLLGEDAAADRLMSLFQSIFHSYRIDRSNFRTTHDRQNPDYRASSAGGARGPGSSRRRFPRALRNRIWDEVEKIAPAEDAGRGSVGLCKRRGDRHFLINRLIPLALKRGIPITVDPKVENFQQYKRVTCVTPNTKEAMECGSLRAVQSEDDMEKLGQALLKKIDADSILITRGEHGMSLFEKKKPVFHIPTRAREVFDVTGAGDTVIGTLTLALAAGAPLRQAAELANYAAGIVVGKLGTASVTGRGTFEGGEDVHDGSTPGCAGGDSLAICGPAFSGKALGLDRRETACAMGLGSRQRSQARDARRGRD